MWRRTDVFADHPTIFQGVRASVIPAVAEPAAGCEAARGQGPSTLFHVRQRSDSGASMTCSWDFGLPEQLPLKDKNCMATKLITTLIDDIDGSDADETVSFRIDGADYEIDLNGANAAALRGFLAPYIAVARKTPRRTRSTGRSKQQVSDLANVRMWAQRNGYTTSTRGRIPAEIREAHAKATA